MRRTSLRLVASVAGAFVPSRPLRDDNADANRQREVAQRVEAEKRAKEFNMDAMEKHLRSSHEYKSSAKGAEVGARNEAAFMNYEEFKPKTLSGILAMPGDVNLLTVSPLYCFLVCVASAAWGIFYWDLYCRKNYETVLIARPKALQ